MNGLLFGGLKNDYAIDDVCFLAGNLYCNVRGLKKMLTLDIYELLDKKQKEQLIEIFLESLGDNEIVPHDWDIGRLEITLNDYSYFDEDYIR